jgi:hypothetical protein
MSAATKHKAAGQGFIQHSDSAWVAAHRLTRQNAQWRALRNPPRSVATSVQSSNLCCSPPSARRQPTMWLACSLQGVPHDRRNLGAGSCCSLSMSTCWATNEAVKACWTACCSAPSSRAACLVCFRFRSTSSARATHELSAAERLCEAGSASNRCSRRSWQYRRCLSASVMRNPAVRPNLQGQMRGGPDAERALTGGAPDALRCNSSSCSSKAPPPPPPTPPPPRTVHQGLLARRLLPPSQSRPGRIPRSLRLRSRSPRCCCCPLAGCPPRRPPQKISPADQARPCAGVGALASPGSLADAAHAAALDAGSAVECRLIGVCLFLQARRPCPHPKTGCSQ